MIAKTKAYISDGKVFPTLEAAQANELTSLIISNCVGTQMEKSLETVEFFVDVIMSDKDKIVDILTTKASSKPRARSINGGKKNRPAKTAQTAEV